MSEDRKKRDGVYRLKRIGRDGRKYTLKRYYIDFFDHRNNRRRMPATNDLKGLANIS